MSSIPRPDLSARALETACELTNGHGTRVRLTHSGFVSEASRDAHEENWPLALEILAAALQ